MADITKIYRIEVQGQQIVLDEMKKVNKEFDESSKKWKELKKLIAAGGLSSADLAKHTEEMKRARLETESLRQEGIKLRNEKIAMANADRIQASEQKRAREEARLSADDWKKLLQQLNQARNNAKNLGVKFGIDSGEFKAAQQQVTTLDAQVKQIESRLGQFQRNVGNYAGNQMMQGLNKNTLESLVKSGFGKLISNQVNEARGRVKELDSQLTALGNKLDAVKNSGTKDFDAIQKEIIENRNEAAQYVAQIDRIEKELRNMSNVGGQHLNNLKNYFRNLKSEITSFVVGYLSFQAAFTKGQELVQHTYELADGVTNLEVELQKAAGGADDLVSKLSKIDTRTLLPELVNIANIAVKAGVNEGDLTGVVSGIDKIKIAFGKDFGDVEEGTESLVKLINVFENGQVTEDLMLRTGNAVRTIANESVASVPYLNDFSKRMAGLKGISEITLPSVLGLASGFEQYGQSAETSSTALVRIIPKIAAETEKFAKYANMSQKEFSDLINSNPAEALIKVSEGITKNKVSIEELVQSLGDSELAKKGGAGIVSTLGVLGKNSETFRKTIKSATEAYKDTSNITEAFNKKNENLSAGMDKLKKNFVDMANNQGFQSFLKGAITLIALLTGAIAAIPMSVWIGLVTLLTLAYYENIKAMAISIGQTIVYAARTVIGNALITASNILIRAQAIALAAANLAWRILNATMLLISTVIPGVRTAWIALNLTIMATPIGWIIAGIAAVGAALMLMSAKAQDSAETMNLHGKALKDAATQMKLNSEISKIVIENTKDQISKTEMYTRILKDNAASLDVKKRALQALINLNPQYLSALTLENIKTAEGTKILDDYKKKLIEVAKAKATEALLIDKQKRLTELEMSSIEDADNMIKAKGYKNNVFDRRSWGEFAKGVGGLVGIGPGDAEDVYNDRLKERVQLTKEINILTGEQVKNLTSGKTNLPGETPGGGGASGRTLTMLKEELDALNKEFQETEINSKRYLELKKIIKEKSDYYDSLTKTGTTKTYKGSRLTGTQKDVIKDLEAEKNNNLAVIKEGFVKGDMLQEDYIKKSLAVDVKFFDSKIAYLKKGNAEERKQVAQANLDKIEAQQAANDKLFTLSKKSLDDQLKNTEYEIQRKRDLVLNNPYSSEQMKLDAEKTYYQESTSAQIEYNQKVLDTQIKHSKDTVEETVNMLKSVKEKLDQENRNTLEYRIKIVRITSDVIDETSQDLTNANEILAAQETRLVLQNKLLSAEERRIALQKISADLELRNINTELGSVNAKITELEREMTIRELTNDEMRTFNNLLRERNNLEGKKAESEYKNGVARPVGTPGSGMSGLASGITKRLPEQISIDGRDVTDQVGYAIAQSFDIAQQAMNNYFDQERARVEQSKQLAYERIDLEKQQLMRFAQSSAERETLEKQAAEKKKQADKQAGERLKRIKKSEAKIAFLVELGNIWSTAMQLGPIAGPIVGGALSLLAGVRFASTMSNLDKIQYKRGGKFLGSGGKLSGPSHSDGGMPVYDPITGNKVAEMEGSEGIINKRSMEDSNIYNVSGTPSQIASKINSIGGGVDWDGGATIKKFMNGGQYLGSNLQPPIFRSYFDDAGSGFSPAVNERIEKLEGMISDVAEIQKKEVVKKTVLSIRDVDDLQNENKKRTEIGTL